MVTKLNPNSTKKQDESSPLIKNKHPKRAKQEANHIKRFTNQYTRSGFQTSFIVPYNSLQIRVVTYLNIEGEMRIKSYDFETKKSSDKRRTQKEEKTNLTIPKRQPSFETTTNLRESINDKIQREEEQHAFYGKTTYLHTIH